MQIAIICLLSIVVIMLFILIIKIKTNQRSDDKVADKIASFEKTLTKDIGDFKYEFSDNLRKDFENLNDRIERKLLDINEKVNERLDKNFEKTNKTFTNILESITRIDEAQKKIDSLSSDIISLESVLTDKKTRGNFGEFTLTNVLVNVFGENNKKMYRLQHKLSNDTIADAILYTYEPLGSICIDSKFPLENYNRLMDINLSKPERMEAEKAFKQDLKKHIDAISSKYIIPGETTEQAIMFLPAEAVFAEINAHHPDILKYAFTKNVWLTSPTTLMFMLTTVLMVVKTKERDEHAKVIQVELQKLALEFDRYKDRWDKLSKSIDTVSKDVKDLHITSDKISTRFKSINSVNDEVIKIKETNE